MHFLLLRDLAEVLDDERRGNAAQVEALAARENRGQNFFRLGRGEHELHVRGRLFERFEQRVERLLREHVDFVDDVDLELRRWPGRICTVSRSSRISSMPRLLAPSISSTSSERPSVISLQRWIVIGEIDLRAAGAVEAFGENAGDGGLAGAARPAEKIGVGDAVLLDGVGQRLRDVLLADDIGEALRPIFSSYDLIRHAMRFTITISDCDDLQAGCNSEIRNPKSQIEIENARVTTADAEQTTVAAFRPWRGS